MSASTDTPALPFASLSALRQAHADLLRRARAAGSDPELDTDVRNFLARGRATGTLLDNADDRWAVQSLLDYWTTTLYSASGDAPDATLAEFDPRLAPALPDELCPYVGLDPFGERDAERFFGRARIVAEWIERLRTNRLLAVVGPSGSGKSSLVRAGLLPALRNGALPESQNWRYLTLVPGSEPLLALARALLGDDLAADAAATLADQLRAAPTAILTTPAAQQPLLVLVDQFEELFTLCNDRAARQACVDALLALVDAPTPAHRVVLTMRSDFESFVAQLPALQQRFEQARAQVPPLSAAELREAIEAPAARVGLRFEAGVVDALLHDILGEPAALPLLQFTLLKLWDNRERNRVTMASYQRLGGGRLALARSADALYTSLIVEEQISARRILLRLVRPTEGLEVTSSRVRVADLVAGGEDPGRVERVLRKLIAARLLRLSPGANPADAQVEVAHEALIRNWPRLVEWLDEEREALRQRRRLTAAAEEWERLGRSNDALLRGGALDEVADYSDLSPLEATFVAASQEAVTRAEAAEQARRENLARAEGRAQAEAQANRRLRWLVGALGLLLVLTVLAALFAAQQQQQAQQEAQARSTAQAETLREVAVRAAAQARAENEAHTRATAEARARQARDDAEHQTRQATARELAQRAQSLDSPEQHALLAIEAMRVNMDVGEPPVPVARQTLYDALAGLEGRGLGSFDSGVAALVGDSAGRWLAAASRDGALRLFRMQASEPVSSSELLAPKQGSGQIAISADGRRLAAASQGRVYLWNLNDPAASRVELPVDESLAALAFSPDGASLAGCAGRLYLWSLDGPTPQRRSFDGDYEAATFSPDGRRLVASSRSLIDVWATADLDAPPVRFDGAFVAEAVFSPDSATLAAAVNNLVYLWNLQAADPRATPRVLEGPKTGVRRLAFSPDGATLATISDDAALRLWQLNSSEPGPRTITDTTGAPVFSPDGRLVAAGGTQGSSAEPQDARARGQSSVLLVPLAEPGLPPLILRGLAGSATALAFSADSSAIVAGDAAGSVRRWPIAGAAPAPVPQQLAAPPTASLDQILASADGQAALARDSEGRLRRWDLGSSASPLPSQPLDLQATTALARSADGRIVAVGDANGTITLLNIASAATLTTTQTLRAPGTIEGLALNADGSRLAANLNDGSIAIWNLRQANTAPQRIAAPTQASLRSLALSADGTLLAVGDADGSIRLYQVAGSQPQLVAAVQSQGGLAPQSVLFSPDGKLLASYRPNAALQIWRIGDTGFTGQEQLAQASSAPLFTPDGQALILASGTLLLRYTTSDLQSPPQRIGTQQAPFPTLALSRDGSMLAANDTNGALLIWNLRAPAQPLHLGNGQAALFGFDFAPDGRFILASGAAGHAQRWELRPDALIANACQTLGRSLSASEWQQFFAGQPYRATCTGLP